MGRLKTKNYGQLFLFIIIAEISQSINLSPADKSLVYVGRLCQLEEENGDVFIVHELREEETFSPYTIFSPNFEEETRHEERKGKDCTVHLFKVKFEKGRRATRRRRPFEWSERRGGGQPLWKNGADDWGEFPP